MKSLKVEKNGEHVATASIEALDGLEANMLFEAGRENPVLRIQGHKVKESGLSNYLWADTELSLGDVVTVEYINSKTQDKPPHELHSKKAEPHCAFCKRIEAEAGKLFYLPPPFRPNAVGVCRQCLVSFAAAFKHEDS